ncbi:MAG: hypothetical protein OWT27_02880, partial [Firmicutes bacterium]|nr:hypothetical protein [Bacillota bacterium]
MKVKTLIAALVISTGSAISTIPLADTSAATTLASPLPSRTWVESYPALLHYADVPVLVPALGTMAKIHSFLALAGTEVNANRDGYQATLAPIASLPPWTTQQPIIPGAQTSFTFAGARATPNLDTDLYLGLPANADFDDLPGLPISLAHGVTGYLTYFRNITGNGGSSTTLTWKAGGYLYQVSVPIAAGTDGRQAAIWIA